jgi:NAD(P)H dehydrogenase (quinone)
MRDVKILLVYAHPEPKSFNGQMRDVALSTLRNNGHEVRESDLYAMNFNPIAGRGDFLHHVDPDFFHLQTEQDRAYAHQTFAEDIRSEQEKIEWCELVLFQFPLWWQSLPAVLKGWIDRVLARSFAYGPGRVFETGLLRGKKAMCALTTGSSEQLLSPSGFYGRTVEELLRHLLHGTLAFCGMKVLPPFVAFSAAKVSEEERQKYLDDYAATLRNIESREPLVL